MQASKRPFFVGELFHSRETFFDRLQVWVIVVKGKPPLECFVKVPGRANPFIPEQDATDEEGDPRCSTRQNTNAYELTTCGQSTKTGTQQQGPTRKQRRPPIPLGETTEANAVLMEINKSLLGRLLTPRHPLGLFGFATIRGSRVVLQAVLSSNFNLP